MATFTVYDIDTAPEGSRERLAAVKGAWGFIPKLQGTLAESPLALEGYDQLFTLLANKATLSPAEVQVAYMAVNVFHGCEYCTAGHTYLSRQAGVPEQAIQAIRKGGAIEDARLEALRAFTTAVVSSRGHVGDAAVDAFLAAGFTKAQILEVVIVVGTKTISNYTNHITHTPLESFMSDPALRWIAPEKRAAA
jgi:AhpD family alkylhydroperoxidase